MPHFGPAPYREPGVEFVPHSTLPFLNGMQHFLKAPLAVVALLSIGEIEFSSKTLKQPHAVVALFPRVSLRLIQLLFGRHIIV